MPSSWTKERLLITVRTYPVPARKGIEVSCTAAVSERGDWKRIFPVPYRSLPKERRFAKYQWVEVDLMKANDSRPESYHPNIQTLKLGEKVSPGRNWAARRSILKPLMRPSLCAIRRERDENGHPTLGIFKPKKITRMRIVKADQDWTPAQKATLSQLTLGFEKTPNEELEKIPFDFFYDFTCQDEGCKGHKMSCTDWEMAQAYRKWRGEYGDQWEAVFRSKFERDMIDKFDTHFYVGTLHQYPQTWIIVGLFYPPYLTRDPQPDLFEPS